LARKILLADDSVTAQNMGRKILADAGYEVIAVNNGSAALKKIAELKPDLVILDVYMPGYSGLEVCQRLKDSQETARIPVLLSVGKLEPFKPEEAQRVRADAFIVKPFEASELLSALSKLEDKVVPRSEPSKPGRFARAIAAAEESGRSDRNQPSGDESGWKTRIGFPHEKTQPEEKVADEASIYNPMNRDLRTVVDKSPVENAKSPADKSAEASEHAVAVPPNLLNDVTPEEVAAIAAAVAQMQMASATEDISQPASEDAKPETTAEIKVDLVAESPAEAAAPPALSVPDDAPATMAAGSESEVVGKAEASRWTAVSVPLDAEEAAISLEREMREAYASFVVTETEQASTVATAIAEPASERAEETSLEPSYPQAHTSSDAQAVSDSSVAVIAISEPEPVTTAAPDETVTASPEQPPVADASAFAVVADPVPSEPALPEPVTVLNETSQQEESIAVAAIGDASPIEAQAVTAVMSAADVNQQPAPVAELAIVPEIDAASAPQTHEAQSAPEPEAAIAQAVAASAGGSAASSYAQIIQKAEHEPDPRPESEVMKSTAAAWASWRQVRDTSDAKADSAETKQQELETPGPAPSDSAAMAVAAGAEQIAQEVPAALPAENPPDVASIVDSVLADLRPRLMAEISRKMAEKK
jgi:CheY-like chemotaxis protein